jgi:hypothetical protein
MFLINNYIETLIFLFGIVPKQSDTAEHKMLLYYKTILYYKKWKYNETVHQLFRDFKKAFDSVREGKYCTIFS